MLTKERAEELVSYTDDQGILCRKIGRGNRAAGSLCTTLDRKGYYRIMLDGVRYKSHHIVWLLHKGYLPKQLEHINEVKTDNRIENLREATTLENCNYRVKGCRTNKLGLAGVHKLSTGDYRSQVCFRGKKINLGRFQNPNDAHEAYLNYKKGIRFAN